MRPESTPALQGVAQCYDKIGKTASAWAKYRELQVEFKVHGDTEHSQAAGARAEELGKILSTLTIKRQSTDATGFLLRLDSEEVPQVMIGTKINVDPGQHVLQATAPGFEVWETKIVVGARPEAREVQLPALVAKGASSGQPVEGAPAPPFTWGAQRTVGVVLGVVGLVGLGTGSAFTVKMVGKNNDSLAYCPTGPTRCYAPGVALRNQAIDAAHIATGTFIAGATLLAGGIVVFLTAPSGAPNKPDTRTAQAQLRPIVGPGLAGVALQGVW